jgi:CRP/FNR family transcriptional activator FtrB
MRSDDLASVRRLPLFATMREEHFAALTPASYLQTFPSQMQLIAEGDHADFLHVVVEGSVELFARHNGRETTLALLRPVSTFILAAVIEEAVHLMSARTTEKSRVLMIPAQDIRDLIGRDAAFSAAILCELAGGFRALVRELKNQKLRTAVERLANHLLRLDAEQGGRGAVELPYDKRTLASLLGMTPENLSRGFATLRPYGVEVNGGSIRLTKPDDLRRLAKPSPLVDPGTR